MITCCELFKFAQLPSLPEVNGELRDAKLGFVAAAASGYF